MGIGYLNRKDLRSSSKMYHLLFVPKRTEPELSVNQYMGDMLVSLLHFHCIKLSV